MNNPRFFDHQIFPQYPNPVTKCPLAATSCLAPASLASFIQNDISAFAHDFQTPHVEQASLSSEREFADRMAAGISLMYVHGEHLIRARDVNLPTPTQVSYPVFDQSGSNFLGIYDTV